MAVDTRDRRFAMLGLGQAWGSPVVFPNPEVGGVDSGDFEQWLYSYPGIQFAGAGDPRMMRWGGLPLVRQRPLFGRSW